MEIRGIVMHGIWNELKIVVEEQDIEIVEGVLYGMGVQGLSVEDPKDILDREKGPLTWDFADLNIFEFGADKAVIRTYFHSEEEMEVRWTAIGERLAELEEQGILTGKPLLTRQLVKEEDWANTWKQYYKPTRVGSRFVIRPIWEPYSEGEGDVVLHLDPGMAFGTGTHETTRLCLAALERHVQTVSRVLDIGTGSGILAIGAAKLGAGEVIGVDLDPVAVESALQNVGHNGLDNVRILQGNLMDVVEGTADVIVANILAEIILVLIPDVRAKLKEGGIFIASGIIREKEVLVTQRLREEGFTIHSVDHDGEWVAVTAGKE